MDRPPPTDLAATLLNGVCCWCGGSGRDRVLLVQLFLLRTAFPFPHRGVQFWPDIVVIRPGQSRGSRWPHGAVMRALWTGGMDRRSVAVELSANANGVV